MKRRSKKMEQEIINMISSVGFPIVACIFLYKQNCNQAASHKEELKTMGDIIQNNTLSITKLYEKMDTLIDVLRTRMEVKEHEDC